LLHLVCLLFLFFFGRIFVMSGVRRYGTRDEAVVREIVEPIEAGDVDDARAVFDVDGIAEKVLGGYEHGFSCVVDADTFWEIVACHAL